MNILIICSKSPYPPKEGGSIAMYNIIKGLQKKNFTIKVLAISTPKFPIIEHEIPNEFINNTYFESCFIDTMPNIKDGIINLISNKPYHISRFQSCHFEGLLKSILQANYYDVIQLESLYVAPYIKTIREYSKAKIILRAHNIEHLIWKRIAETTKNILKKTYLNIQSRRLKKYELSIINSFDGIAAITDTDKEYFIKHKCLKPITTIPFGIDINNDNFDVIKREVPSLFFLGSLNWIPNIDGLKWFINNVWDSISKEYPDLPFYIAGRHCPDWLKALKKNNIIVLGEVDDALKFMHSKSIMIVPLFSGSGMRVKIIEGMYSENVIISTTIGTEGIETTNGKDILIADSIDGFKNAIKYCMDNPIHLFDIGMQAKKTVLEKYLNDTIIEKLISFYKSI